MPKTVKTTVIGSYPVKINNYSLMSHYYDQKTVSWDKYIKSAVSDMVKAGVEIVADGQTRDPFVNIFIRKLKGCRIRDRPEVIDKVEYDKPIVIEDQKLVRNIIPDNTQLIGLITGPFTLSKSCVDLFYNDEEELAFDFAKALHNEAVNLQKTVDMISVDEPFFSVSMPDYAEELIKTVVKGVSCPIRLHACGDVSNIVDKLAELPVDILSHEFKASPKLFDSFKNVDFPQKICLGCARSDDSRVETVDEIINHIKHGMDVFDDKICQISPDCGLRLQPRDVAFQKLCNLVKAGEKIYGG
jgi:5-methyltetrahydropteroyltriglutamate--homocysteine methyltransferase